MAFIQSSFILMLLALLAATASCASSSSSPKTSSSDGSDLSSMETFKKFKKLTNLIRVAKMEGCAGRVVCDLNCDPSRFGSNGKKVLSMMVKVQNAGLMDVEDTRLLVTAGLSGRMYYYTSGCDRCKEVYPQCFAESEELIDVASLFDMDSIDDQQQHQR